METKLKPQIQSTVYPEIPCLNFNEWISNIRKELEKIIIQVSDVRNCVQ